MDNYNILKKVRPVVSEMLEKNLEAACDLDKTVKAEAGKARDGSSFLTVTRKVKFESSANFQIPLDAGRHASHATKDDELKTFRLNSAYSPVKEAKRWADQYEINDINAVYFMFGLGNGCFVRELMGKMKSDTVLVVYEPSAKVFKEAMESSDLSDIIENERVILVVRGMNDEYLPQVMERTIFWANMNTLKKCTHPQYDAAFSVEMQEYDAIVWDGYVKARSNVNTAAKFQTMFAPNTLYGMSLMRNSNILMDLYDELDKDVPVIIASAGPSLEKNIDDLKAAKGRAYIMAVDKTVPIFMAHDIMPDFIITIDAKKWPGYFNNPKCREIPLFCLFESNRRILARHTGRKIFFDSSEYPKAILMMAGKNTSSFNTGGSVSTSAYTVCLALGMKNVFFIGQDLAYLDGKTHAGNISSGELSNGGEGNRREVEGIDGNMITTRADWYRYLDWFNQAIESNPECHVVDATEGGAKIQGTEILTLKEAIDKYCIKEVDCKKLMEDLPPALNKNQYLAMIDYIRNSANELVLIKGKLTHSKNDCEKLIQACKNGTINDPKYNKPIKELSKTNKYVESRPVYRLLDSLVVTDAVSALKDIYVQSDDPDENLRRTFEQSHDFYSTLLDAADKLEPILEETINNMENDKWECSIEVKRLGTLVIIFGLGSGKYIRDLLNKCKEDTKLIVYVALPIHYYYAAENPEMADILTDKRICFAMGNKELNRFMEIREEKKNGRPDIGCFKYPMPVPFYEALDMELGEAGEQIVVTHPHYDVAFPVQYKEFKEQIEDGKMRVTAQENTRKAFGKKIIKNQLSALKAAGQAVLPGNLRKVLNLDKPALIVSTGPSLMESVDFIKRIRDKVYVFAVDSSVNFLLNREIIPDFNVTIDPNKWAKHFKKEEAKKIPLFCRMDSNLNILKNQTGPLIYFGSTPFAAGVLERFNKTEDWIGDTGGSVSTAAFAVCLMLGFKKIILVGQDFCYKLESGADIKAADADAGKSGADIKASDADAGKNGAAIKATHANGKISSDEKRQGFDRKYIPGNMEDKVLTRQDWYRYLKWMEQKAAKADGVTLMNATRGGAKINGIPWISQEEVIRMLEGEARNMAGAVSGTEPLFTEEEYVKYMSYLKGLNADLREMARKARKVKSQAAELKNAAARRVIANKKYQSSMKEVSQTNQWMEKQPLYLLCDLLISKEGMDGVYDVADDEMENLRITYEQVEIMYGKIEKALKELEPLIAEFEQELL